MATVIRMPALSDTMTEGTLIAWHKKVGETVKRGDLLADIATDKATMEFECFYNGTLLYAIEADQSIMVDEVIAVIGEPNEDWKAAINAISTPQTAAAEVTPAKTDTKIETPAAVVQTIADDARLKASPLAKSMAKQEGILLSDVKGSGDDGRIVKRDVEVALQNRQAPASGASTETTSHTSAAAEGDYTDVVVTQMRKTIARRLGESKFSAPEFYLTMEINMDKCMTTREALNVISPVKLSFNDFVIKSVAMALRRHPAINSSWLGDKIRTYNYVNMGVAVAVEDGLLVPVVKRADLKSLSEIAGEVKALAEKAKDKKLTPQEMSGNTFTISNLGMFGIDDFTAIINPPDACILAVGRISEKAVRGENNEVKWSNFMKVTLTCDHRVVDGAMGSAFLQTLRSMLEDPMRMLV